MLWTILITVAMVTLPALIFSRVTWGQNQI